MSVALIVPAAGSGSRLGGTTPKQFLTIGRHTVLAHSLSRFIVHVDEIIIVTTKDAVEKVSQIARAVAPTIPTTVVVGGQTRQDSVYAGLQAAQADQVLIHDAARPLIPQSCITACIDALQQHQAAVVAVAVSATVKEVSNAIVQKTVPRDHLFLAQTPQGMHRDIALQAFDHCHNLGISVSDDVQACEAFGIAVAIVPGDAMNLKITTSDDFKVAAALIEAGFPH